MSETHQETSGKLFRELFQNCRIRRERFERWFRATYGEGSPYGISELENSFPSSHRRLLDDAIAALEAAQAYSDKLVEIPLYVKNPDGSFTPYKPTPHAIIRND